MTTTRVRYREGQTLYRDDLLDEQTYRISMRRRHNLVQHCWGIVRGLRLSWVNASSEVELEAGLAIDGFGRELIVPDPVYFTCDGFDSNGDVDVWLVYGVIPLTYSRPGRETCGPGRHSRSREVAEMLLTAADNGIDPRKPVEVPAADPELGGFASLSDNPDRKWPVYLGRIDANGSVDKSRLQYRPYAGLVGESIIAASGQARMQVGTETAGDRRRFVIGIEDENREIKDRLVIDREGNTSHYGNAVLHGDLKISQFPESSSEPDPCMIPAESSGLEKAPPPPGIEFQPVTAVPEKAVPWSIYHAEMKSGEEEQGQEPSLHQLRFEIGNPGDKGDPSRYLFAIGHNQGFAFEPCLSVSADCTVTVNGTLHVGGQVIEGPIQADPDDPDFRDAVQDQWMLAAGETGSKTADAFLKQPAEFVVSVSVTRDRNSGDPIEYSVEVTNGQLPITNLTLDATLNIDGRSDTELHDRRFGPASLKPDEVYRFSGIYKPPTEGTLTINALVSGIGPTGKPIWASGELPPPEEVPS